MSSFQKGYYLWVSVLSAIALSAMTLVYKTHINSDVLFIEYLLQDIFHHEGTWRYWRFSQAPSYFPDMLLYLISFLTIDSIPLRILFVSLLQILILSILGDWLLRVIKPQSSLFSRSLLQFFLLLAVIATNHTATSVQPMLSISLFYLTDNIQVPTVISSLLLLGMYSHFYKNQSIPLGIALVILGALAQASSAVFVICFAMPFFITLCIMMRLALKKNDQHLLKVTLMALLILVLSQIGGYLLSMAVTLNSPIGNRIEVSLARMSQAWHMLKAATANIYDSSNPFSFFPALVCTVACGYALFQSARIIQRAWRSSSMPSIALLMVSSFMVCSVITSVSGVVLSGGFVDIYGYRYFMTFSAVGFILTAVYIQQHNAHERLLSHLLWIVMILVTSLSIYTVWSTPGKRSWDEIVQWGAFPRAEQEIANCIRKISNEEGGIYSGIGDYWSTRAVMYYLDNQIYIQPTLNNLQPFFIASSIESLAYPEKYGIIKYNFVILRNQHKPNQFKYDFGGMRSILPQGFEIKECPAGDAQILIYKNNELDDILQPVFSSFVNRIEK